LEALRFKRVVRTVKKTGIAESLLEVLKLLMIVVLLSAWIPFEVFLEEAKVVAVGDVGNRKGHHRRIDLPNQFWYP